MAIFVIFGHIFDQITIFTLLEQWSLFQVIEDILPFILNTKWPLGVGFGGMHIFMSNPIIVEVDLFLLLLSIHATNLD